MHIIRCRLWSMMIESILISLLSVYRSQRVTPYKNKAYKHFLIICYEVLDINMSQLITGHD
jgi:hypothetical protein